MNKTQQQILSFLNDKEYVSGQEIGKALGISRAAVSKSIKALKENYQINITSNPKLGHILDEKLDLLNQEKLQQSLQNLNYFHSIDSTSKHALAHQSNYLGNAVFIAEHQTDGFGRFNRKWASPFGKNIYCTLLETVELDVSKLNGLSLVVGLSIAKMLIRLGLNAKLKWPNDVFVNDKKIAGVIVNIFAEANDTSKLFIGFGLNVNMLKNTDITKKWTSIKLESGKHANRTGLLIELIKDIRADLDIFITEGFAYFKKDYEKYNYLKDKEFSLLLANKEFKNAKYKALSATGEIIIENDQGSYSFSSGEISILDNSIKSR